VLANRPGRESGVDREVLPFEADTRSPLGFRATFDFGLTRGGCSSYVPAMSTMSLTFEATSSGQSSLQRFTVLSSLPIRLRTAQV